MGGDGLPAEALAKAGFGSVRLRIAPDLSPLLRVTGHAQSTLAPFPAPRRIQIFPRERKSRIMGLFGIADHSRYGYVISLILRGR